MSNNSNPILTFEDFKLQSKQKIEQEIANIVWKNTMMCQGLADLNFDLAFALQTDDLQVMKSSLLNYRESQEKLRQIAE